MMNRFSACAFYLLIVTDSFKKRMIHNELFVIMIMIRAWIPRFGAVRKIEFRGEKVWRDPFSPKLTIPLSPEKLDKFVICFEF